MIARSRAQPEVLVQEHVGRLTVKKNIRFLVDLEQSLVQSGLITSSFPVAGQGAEEPRLKANLRRADFTGAAHRVVVNHSTATGTGAVKGRPMGNLRRRNISTTIVVLGLVLASWMAAAQQAPEAVQKSPLPLEQVVRNLEERNAARTVALRQFEGKRVYRMEYRGFPSNRDAEMVVKVSFRAPNSKEFTVVSQTGSKFVIDHVFKKLLEGEQEAAKGDNQRQTRLSSENYDFEFAAFENTPQGSRYVINLLPKTKNKFLYRGKIWVDAKDFAVIRIEGEPGKNPSFWIKKTEIAHQYVKVDDFWLPAENRTQSVIRLGGTASLSIEYQDYKILEASPLKPVKNPGQPIDSSAGERSPIVSVTESQ